MLALAVVACGGSLDTSDRAGFTPDDYDRKEKDDSAVANRECVSSEAQCVVVDVTEPIELMVLAGELGETCDVKKKKFSTLEQCQRYRQSHRCGAVVVDWMQGTLALVDELSGGGGCTWSGCVETVTRNPCDEQAGGIVVSALVGDSDDRCVPMVFSTTFDGRQQCKLYFDRHSCQPDGQLREVEETGFSCELED